MTQKTRRDFLKKRLSALVDTNEVRGEVASTDARLRSLGQGLLLLGVFILIADLYSNDIEWRAIFAAGGIAYAIVGARIIDRECAPDN